MSADFKDVLIVTDLDGTLLGRDLISESDLKAKEYFESRGGIFTVATGRSKVSSLSVLTNIDIKHPAVLLNGPLIQHLSTSEIFNVTYLPDHTKDILLQVLEFFPKTAIEFYCEDLMYLCNSNEISEHHILTEALDYKICDLDNIPNNWLKVVLLDEVHKLPIIHEFLKDKLQDIAPIWSYGSIFYELINKSADKGSSVLYLAEKYNIPRENIICMGDGVNDIGMIKNAGLGLAVENAHDELKEVADRVIVSNNDSPLTYIIKNIL